ncbi:Cupin domain-containing protein [Rubritalea squalenifaciens DSM 18772]|uniref:Cupin domain-containing protein n=1 Tax=Rubritalea squalenifaciens DSM 18772 TaxID=1123071 RepID=A0A1M6LIN5_9BACT|nr:cupin domain-containing protein [Rubritalea squalenifaciens]SHJ71046.1 Cupin domain-containing protein [Rubritalea squalenifaciens DSM 18772]
MNEHLAVMNPVGEARVIRAFGDEMHLLLSAEDTGGKFTMWTNFTPPGGGPPPHYHENEDEWFWPLSGPAEFLIDGEWRQVPAKTAVFMPRGSIHTFRNPNIEPLEMLIQTMPGGFDKFFAECAEEFDKGDEPDMPKLIDISAKHGIYYVEG